MLDLNSILSPARSLCRAPLVSKKRFFEAASELVSQDQPQLAADVIYASLLAREKLGSTALGHGIAIPHCRLPDCNSALGALITLADPIDFEAPDQQAVDILFVLLVPEQGHQEHLDILAGLAGLLSQNDFCSQLRSAGDAAQLFDVATRFKT